MCVRQGYACTLLQTCDVGYTCNGNHECTCPDQDPRCGVVCTAEHPACPPYRSRCRSDGQCALALDERCVFPTDCAPNGGRCDGLSQQCLMPGALAVGAVCGTSAECQSGLCAYSTCLARCSAAADCAPPLQCTVLGPWGVTGCLPPGDAGPPALVGQACAQRNEECDWDGGQRCVLAAGPACRVAALGLCSPQEATQPGPFTWTDAGVWGDVELCTQGQKCLDDLDCPTSAGQCRDLGDAGLRYCTRAVVGQNAKEWAAWPVPPDHPTGYTFDADTVTDGVTGLTWQRRVGNVNANWGDAIKYCSHLTLAGPKPWRLPTRRELMSLLDYTLPNVAIDTQVFPGTPNQPFWSSSPYVRDGFAWRVEFGFGFTTQYTVGTGHFVRCVR